MSVSNFHPDYAEAQELADMVRDAYAGGKHAKSHIIDPNPAGEKGTPAGDDRLATFKQRAVYYNATSRTTDALIGEVFRKEAEITLPPALEPVVDDTSGSGLNLVQHARRTAIETGLSGCAGLLSNYPMAQGGESAADRIGDAPVIHYYPAKSIINWDTIGEGQRTKLSLIVLVEAYDDSTDEFTRDIKKQFIVLRLRDGKATSQVYRDDISYIDEFELKDSTGKALTEIPFTFVGTENNDANRDAPMLLDIAVVNLAHLNDSANHQEEIFIAGQPTLVVAGLTQNWVKDNFENGVQIGARGGLPLPVGGSAQLLQCQPHGANFTAMTHKEAQMIALGAKLIEPQAGQRTATEASIDEAEATSSLSTLSMNLSAAYTRAFKFCAQYIGASDEIEINFSTEFGFHKLSAQERQQLMAEWQGGGITFAEYRTALRDGGAKLIEDDEALAEIDEQNALIPAIPNADAE